VRLAIIVDLRCGPSQDRVRVGGRPDSAGELERGGGKQELTPAKGCAGLGQFTEPPELSQGEAEERNQPSVLEAILPRHGKDFNRGVVRADSNNPMVPEPGRGGLSTVEAGRGERVVTLSDGSHERLTALFGLILVPLHPARPEEEEIAFLDVGTLAGSDSVEQLAIDREASSGLPCDSL